METDQQDVWFRHEGLILSEAVPASLESERLSASRWLDRGFMEQPQHLKNAFPSDTKALRTCVNSLSKQSGCMSARALRAPLVMELSGARV